LASGDTAAWYAPPGYLLFVREGALLAQRFDASASRLSGDAMTLVPRVLWDSGINAGYFSVSENGRLAYRTNVPTRSQLVWVDRTGRDEQLLTTEAAPPNVALSPDQHRAAIVRRDPQSSAQDIWLVDLVRGSASRFSSSARSHDSPIWAPDGSRVVFATDAVSGGYYDLFEEPAAGGAERVLLQGDGDKIPLDWSRDGRFILYQRGSPTTRADVWVLPLFGDRKPMSFLQTAADERDAHFSPDGKWVAYTSDESGATEVYVQPFPATGAKFQISSDSATFPRPRWANDGQELFYVSSENKLMSVALSYRHGIEAAAPKPLFNLAWTADYAASRDGRRFLLQRVTNDPFAAPIDMILNWPATLKN